MPTTHYIIGSIRLYKYLITAMGKLINIIGDCDCDDLEYPIQYAFLTDLLTAAKQGGH